MGKKLLQAKLDEILLLSFSDEDRKMMTEMMTNMLYYHRLIPKSMEVDIVKCIDLCIREKLSLDNFRASCSCGLDVEPETLVSSVVPETDL